MERIDGIMGEYRRGDFRKRLDLYLEHRDMRGDFDRIDREDESIKTDNLFKPVIPIVLSSLRSIFLKFIC